MFQKQILRLIQEQQARTSSAILFISHDLGVVAKICTDVSIIYGGMIVENQKIESLLETPISEYTKSLLAATPRYDRPSGTLLPVPDNVIDTLQKKINAYDLGKANA